MFKRFLNHSTPTILTFCLSIVITSAICNSSIDTIFKVVTVIIFIAYTLTLLFGSAKKFIKLTLILFTLLVIGAFISENIFIKYQFDTATIIVPAVLCTFFGTLYIFDRLDISEKIRYPLLFIPTLVYFAIASSLIIYTKITLGILYVGICLAILLAFYFTLKVIKK